MPDPEGFKAGSAWMDVKPRVDQAEWDARISAAVEEAGKAQGSPLGRSLTKSLEDAKPQLVRDADEIGTQVGSEIGTSTASGIDTTLRKARPRLVSAGQASGTDIAKGVDDGLTDAVDEVGREAGGRLGESLVVGADGRVRDARGRFVSLGRTSGEDVGAGLGDGLSKGIDPGLTRTGQKIKDSAKKSGEDAGKAAGQGMSPLIAAGIAAGATIGGPLLLAGVGAAMVGATGLILKQNKVIAGDFAQTGKDASDAIQQAAAPLTAELHQNLLDVDRQVRQLRPDFKDLFAAAEPDISTVTSGLTGFVGKLLPGMAQATKNSQVIVTDFSRSLPILGSNVGGFFSGLVRNADTQGAALEGTINALGNTVRTVGSLIGSTSAAASIPLLGLTHVINGLDDAARAVGTPAVVGGVLGLAGALKFDPKIASGLLTGAEGLSKVADKAVPVGGLVGKVGSAASGTSTALSKMAGIVDGPWGIAIGAGIGLASGLAAELFHADEATKAITLDQTSLAAAVAQDGAKAGEATSAYIAHQAQVSGLADEAKKAGVSLSLLTEAATGNQSAMSQLTSITGATNDVQRQQQLTAEESLTGQVGLTQAHKQGFVAVNSLYSSTVQLATGQDRLNQSWGARSQRRRGGTVASNTLSDANQQLLASAKAQVQQVAAAIQSEADLEAAERAVNNTTDIFNATLNANYQALVSKAQATADTTVATLNLGSGQSQLNQALAASVAQYDLATSEANGYQGVLTALSGTVLALDNAEAGFTIALDGVSKAAQANGTSLDVNTVKGAQNIQAFTGVAQAADKAAVSLYQTEVSTKGANVAFADANNKLLTEKSAFEQAAIKAGFNKQQIDRLADSLFKLPQDIPIDVHANTTPALTAVNTTINRINDSYGTIQVYANVHNPSGGKALGAGGGTGALTNQGYASGGPVTAGSMVAVGEHQQETAVFGQDAYILTHGQTVAMQSRPATPAGAAINATFNYYGSARPDPESKAQMMRDLAGVLA